MEFIGNSKAALLAVAKAKNAAGNSLPCLIIGEDGAGKTRLAQIIHKTGRREAEPFIIFDAGAAANIEKGLFGFVKTSILGIENITTGALDAAASGTLLIKNIHACPLYMQPQLTATIELGGYKPAGSNETLKSLCRFIFTLPENPEKYIDNRRLLPELVQTLNRNVITIPPLRDRAEDIEPLANYFLTKASANIGLPKKGLTKQAVKLLKKSSWFGNAAELQKVLLNASLNFDDKILDAHHLQLKIDGNWRPHTEKHLEQIALEELVEKKLRQFMDRLGRYEVENLHGTILEKIERPLIKLVMEKSNNNQLKASRILGINRNTLRSKLQKLELI
ncbi:MAG: sigma-54-dependent Fis family transcriptional regulator [Deltaproteobacteria bacterium]|nr:sigma-54-dependent Fis family transcriptional regulator [Deltaproteobacteria bacterium]